VDKETEPKKQEGRDDGQMAKWLTIGIEFTLVVVAGAALGYLLDVVFDSLPGFIIIGFFAGFARMIYVILFRAGYFDRDREK
jgi:F0F1-type ATP synthase assembly protein I